MITGHQYQQFMDRIVADQRGKNPLILGEWEGNFVASYQRSSRPSLWFTPGRRLAVDRMWMKWGPDLKFPHPLDTVSERPRILEADPAGCEYLVRGDDGRQHHCNEPAAWQGERRGVRAGLRYCEAHKIAVDRAFNHNAAFRPWSAPVSGAETDARRGLPLSGDASLTSHIAAAGTAAPRQL